MRQALYRLTHTISFRSFGATLLAASLCGACDAPNNHYVPAGNGATAADASPATTSDGAQSMGGSGVPQNCPNGGTTTISGTVFAPNDTLPLYNAIVYIPTTAVEDFPEGVSCDVCDGKVSGNPSVSTLSLSDGKFTLTNAPSGSNLQLVIQLGKWRKIVPLPAITACQPNDVDPHLTNLPTKSSEGHIPLTAIATGRSDPMECLLLKIGIDPSEIQPATANTRVQFFTGVNQPGATMAGAQSATSLYPDLKNYDIVLLPCEGGEFDQSHGQTPDPRGLVAAYVNSGGRLFATHYSYDWLTYAGSPFNVISNTLVNGLWDKDQHDYPGGNSSTLSTVANLVTSFPKGMAFAQWLLAAGATSPANELDIVQIRHDLDDVNPTYAQAWATDTMTDGKPGIAHLTFNTPLGGVPSDMGVQYCGRVVFSDFHVVASDQGGGGGGSGTFPASCASGPMTDQEKALAFMLFDLSSCVVSDQQPPPPIQ